MKDPASVKVRLALAFPDLYEIGMSYLGQAILYHAVNRIPEFWAERVFMPTLEVGRTMEEKGIVLCTLESDTPLAGLDAVGFSLTHELCYSNVLHMLHLAGLPLRAADRPDWPLIMAGGGCVYSAEPLAPFLDLMVLGDGEEFLPEILRELAEAKEKGLCKKDFLGTLLGQPGIYVPSLSSGGRRRIVEDLNTLSYPIDSPIPFEAVHDRFVLEIARGCTRGCRFCQAGMIYRPVRERSLDNLVALSRKGLTHTGHTEISFLSLSSGDFSDLPGLFERCMPLCREHQISISLPSLRVGSVDEGVMRQLAYIRRTGATLAPEAGSERLRAVINKGITEEALLAQAGVLSRLGWRHVKLYFMIGLPSETEDDLRAIKDLCLKVAAVGESGARLHVTAAVSTFVPKAHTPFQWEAQLCLEKIRQSIGFLKDIFASHKALTLKWHKPEMSFLEGLFSRGDRDLAPVLEKAWRKGAILCSWSDHLRLEPWLEAMAECGISADDYLGARPLESPLPWDHLDCGVSRDFLLIERTKAFQLLPTKDCRLHSCSKCGACSGQTRPRLNPRHKSESAPDQEAAHMALAARSNKDLGLKAAHLRLKYQKIGPAVYLSQLELQTVFERAMRKAALPLSFSQGFHPMPLMSFGRALPVGVASLEEYLDIFLRKDIDERQVAEDLSGFLPLGLDISGVERLGMAKTAIQAHSEDFLMEFVADSAVVKRALLDWGKFTGFTRFNFMREDNKGRVKVTDVRPLFEDIQIDQAGAVSFRLNWAEAYVNPLQLVALVTPELDRSQIRLTKLRQRLA